MAAPIDWFRLLVPNAVGNCIVDHVAVAKHRVRSGRRVGLLYDPAQEFHIDLILCNPYLDEVCAMDSFCGDPDQVMDATGGLTWNYLIENTEVVRMRAPQEAGQDVLPALREHGIEVTDPILALHVREPGYQNYVSPDHESERFVQVETFIQLAQLYLHRGFKVVRIGDPGSTPFPPQPGLFDAAHWAGKRLVHDAWLIEHAALLVATDSGIWPLGVALGTPSVLSNSCHGQPALGTRRHWFPWEPGHRVLNKRLFVDGREVGAREGVKLFRGERWRAVEGKVRLEDNTLEQLTEVVESLLQPQKEEAA